MSAKPELQPELDPDFWGDEADIFDEFDEAAEEAKLARAEAEIAAGKGIPHEKVAEFHLSLGPFRQVVKDYFQICQSYFDAVRRLPPAQIEAIDMARRGIHNEGARTLQERLEGKAELDIYTARRLFTLICALIPQG